MKLNLIAEFKAHPRHAQSVLFSPDGNELATTGMDALVQIWSVPEFERLRSLTGHEKSANAIDLSPDGKTALTGSTDRTVIIWDWESGEQIHRLAGHRNTVAAVKFSPDGTLAATSSYGGRVGIWRKGSDSLDIFRSHPKHVTSVSFSTDGKTLATAGLGNVVKMWDIKNLELVKELEAPGQAATSCLYLPGGNLCCTTYEGELAVYAEETYELVMSGALKCGRVNSSVVLRGTNSLFCSVDGGVAVLDLANLEVLAHYETGIKGMYGVASSPDGNLAAAVSADGRCRVWEIVR